MNWNKIKHNLVEIHAKHRLVPSDLRTRGMYKRADVFRFSFFPRTISSTVGQFQAVLGSITLPMSQIMM